MNKLTIIIVIIAFSLNANGQTFPTDDDKKVKLKIFADYKCEVIIDGKRKLSFDPKIKIKMRYLFLEAPGEYKIKATAIANTKCGAYPILYEYKLKLDGKIKEKIHEIKLAGRVKNKIQREKDEEYYSWQRAKQRNTIHAYQEYIENCCYCDYKNIAEQRIWGMKTAQQESEEDNNAWHKADSISTEMSYGKYLEAYPNGTYVEKALQRINKLEHDKSIKKHQNTWSKAEDENTIESYNRYITQYPEGEYLNEAQDRIFHLEDEQLWNKIENSTIIPDFEDYLEKYGNNTYYCKKDKSNCYRHGGLYKEQAKQRILDLKYEKNLKSGNEMFENSSFLSALQYFKNAQKAKDTYEIREKIRVAEEEITWRGAVSGNSISSFKKYLEKYPFGKYKKQCRDSLCIKYYFRINSLISKRNITPKEKDKLFESAKNDYTKYLCTYCCPENTTTGNLKHTSNRLSYYSKNGNISAISSQQLKELKRKFWNYSYNDRFYYSFYTRLDNSQNLSGISMFKLKNRNVGYYLNFAANSFFYEPKQTISTFQNDGLYTLQYNKQSKVSSSSFTVGLTKKVYRPLFLYFGLGANFNSIAKSYSVTDSLQNENQLWLTNSDNNWQLNSELGFIVDLGGAVAVQVGIRIPVYNGNSNSLLKHEKVSYSLGLGFAIGNHIDSYKGLNFISFRFDLGKPVNIHSFGNEMFENQRLFGISLGKLNDFTLGWYSSLYLNTMLFEKKYGFSVDENLDYFTGNTKFSYAFLTGGLTKKIIFPLWLNVGIGGYYKGKIDEYILNFYNQNADPEDALVRTSSKFGVNSEIGLNLTLWHLLFSANINAPDFNFKSDNLIYSFGVGVNF